MYLWDIPVQFLDLKTEVDAQNLNSLMEKKDVIFFYACGNALYGWLMVETYTIFIKRHSRVGNWN